MGMIAKFLDQNFFLDGDIFVQRKMEEMCSIRFLRMDQMQGVYRRSVFNNLANQIAGFSDKTFF